MNTINCILVLVLSVAAAVFGVEYDDFDELAKEYAEEVANSAGRRLVWYDVYGKNRHLVERPQYSKYKITAVTDQVKYGHVEKTVEKPRTVYSQWFHNSQSVPIVTEFVRDVTLKSSYSWSLSTSVRINYDVKAKIGVPQLFLGVDAHLNLSVDLQKTEAESIEQTERYSLKNVITIPPKKSVKAEFIVTEKDVQIPWEADVKINGYIALWLDPKYNGHWLWFHPISYLANEKFKISPDGDSLMYHAKGLFRGLKGVDTVLKTYEYELVEGASTRDYNIVEPVKVRVHTPKLEPL